MSFNIIHSVPQVSKPLRQIYLQKIPKKLFEIMAEVSGEPGLYKQSNASSNKYNPDLLLISVMINY